MTERDDITLQLVAERLKGLRDITERGFVDIQRQLDDVKDLPVAFSRLQADHDALNKRLSAVEDSMRAGGEWKRGSLPVIVLTLGLLLTSIITVVHYLVT